MSKRKRKKKRSVPYYSQQDFHHFFFPKNTWNRKYSTNTLRSHPYCGSYVLKYTEHIAIHNAVSFVPMPSEDTCRYVVNTLNTMYEEGKISDKDNIFKRYNVIISLLGDCPTADALRAQRNALGEFRRRRW